MIDVVRSFCDTWRIEINLAKSQVEVHPRGVCRKAEGYYYGSKAIEVVKQYKYLGLTLTDTLSWDAHHERALAKARKGHVALHVSEVDRKEMGQYSSEVDRKEMGQYSRLLAVLIDTFQGYDSNQDQRLSIAEFLTLSKAYFPDSDAGQQKATARERFRAMDSDQDKHLVFTEYSQMRTGLPLHTPFNQGLLEGPSRSRSTFKPGQPSGEVPCVGENAQDLRAQNERLLKNLRPRPPIMSDISDFSGWKVVVPDDRYEEFKKSFEDPEKAPPREF
eukprot:g31753.t1